MLFLNTWLLVGLAGVLVPIVLHLIRRQAAKPLDWGAMRFLFDTVAMRKRRIEWEDMLLMAARCLLVALLALALARPFVPPDSTVPWMFLVPLLLLGIGVLGASFVISGTKKRWMTRLVALVLLVAGAGLVILEERFNLKRFQTTGSRDIALVIDASSSMSMPRDGRTSFELAVEEASRLVREAPRGTSFSVVLGGPAPELKTGSPLTHRADVLEVLESLRPVGGPFRAHDALGMALLGLGEGNHPAKEIVVFTDGQRIGWRLDSPSAWKSWGEALEGLPRPPKLLVRSFPPPEFLRNIAVSGVELSREVVGTDREVTIRVTLENTGTEAVTPEPVELEIDGVALEAVAIGQLAPQQEETVEFRHRFKTSGPAEVEARLVVQDDLPDDNRYELVVPVKQRLKVLLIDGNANGGFFDRAAGFTALALAPSESLFRSADKFEGDYLIEPVLMSSSGVGSLEEFGEYGVVVLADVPRLPADLAENLASYVAHGGGLMMLAGPRAEEGFYNGWEGADGPVMPIELGELVELKEGVSPVAATFDHEALQLFMDDQKSDLREATLAGIRKTGKVVKGGGVVARYSNGEPFLASRSYGSGRVMVSTCGFDSRMGNLMTRRSFVPLVHEMVTWLAGGGGVKLNVEASWKPALELPGGGGLMGEYFRSRGRQKRLIGQRIDPVIDFRWEGGEPMPRVGGDEFSVRWRGMLLPPVSGKYVLEATANDRMTVTIDGEVILRDSEGKDEKGRVTLDAGRAVSMEVEYEEDYGDAEAALYWTRPGGRKQLIPSTVLFPLVEGQSGGVLSEGEAIDPSGAPRKAQLFVGRRGRVFEVEGAAVPGLYRLKLPKELRDEIEELSAEEVPFVVKRDVRESRFDTMTDDDRALVRKEIDLVEARSVEDLIAVLSGKRFGQELWKYLAIGAFFLLLAEVALARWISKSRRAGEEVRVDFEDRGGPDAATMERMKQLRKAG